MADQSQVAGTRILWICPHLPRPDQDGGDLRRWQMMTTLSEQGAAVSVWAETGHDSGRYGPALVEANVSWSAPPPATRHDTSPGSTRLAVRDLVASETWDDIIISYGYLADRHLESIRKSAPTTPVLIDLGNSRFHRGPKSDEPEITNAGELELYQTADALITASESDTSFLLKSIPQIPAYTFGPLAQAPPPLPQSTADGPLVFWGNMTHHANANAVAWWMNHIAGNVARRHGTPIPLELRGPGVEVYKSVWGASGKLTVGVAGPTLAGARALLLPLRHSSESATIALSAAARGIPIVATSAAVAGLNIAVSSYVSLGEDAGELARLIVQVMVDDETWTRQRDGLFAAARSNAKRRGALEQEFADWIARRRQIVAKTERHSDAS